MRDKAVLTLITDMDFYLVSKIDVAAQTFIVKDTENEQAV
jgi:hypothetical protein